MAIDRNAIRETLEALNNEASALSRKFNKSLSVEEQMQQLGSPLTNQQKQALLSTLQTEALTLQTLTNQLVTLTQA